MRADAVAPALSPVLLRRAGWCVAAAMIAAALLPLVPRAAPSLPVTLQVAGHLEHTRPEALRLAVAPVLNADFYAIDLAAAKARAESLPWVAQARVERAWPDTVRVTVHEHRAAATWNGTSLLSTENVVFTPAADELPPGLPQLAGPAGSQQAVRGAFEVLVERLAGTPFVPAGLTLNARGEWTAVTADGIELRLGRGAPEASVATLAGPVRTALLGRLQEVAYVDLHYINGFAVGWRSAEPGGGDGRAGEADVDD